jgi:hypothetical protein
MYHSGVTLSYQNLSFSSVSSFWPIKLGQAAINDFVYLFGSFIKG